MKHTKPRPSSREFIFKIRQPEKRTALLHLKSALVQERYEECAGIIAAAREFGATERDIRDLLEDPRREVT
ncbi:MAG: hypothetical protein HQL11_00625 [Candidatus Omnitrophica bacterium]|nr:hypothetical protein [Candidatus Omnitrophota bacterium]